MGYTKILKQCSQMMVRIQSCDDHNMYMWLRCSHKYTLLSALNKNSPHFQQGRSNLSRMPWVHNIRFWVNSILQINKNMTSAAYTKMKWFPGPGRLVCRLWIYWHSLGVQCFSLKRAFFADVSFFSIVIKTESVLLIDFKDIHSTSIGVAYELKDSSTKYVCCTCVFNLFCSERIYVV